MAYLDTCVTVVDALSFPSDFGSGQTLEDREWSAMPGDSRNIVDLLVDQVRKTVLSDVLVTESRLGMLHPLP